MYVPTPSSFSSRFSFNSLLKLKNGRVLLGGNDARMQISLAVIEILIDERPFVGGLLAKFRRQTQ